METKMVEFRGHFTHPRQDPSKGRFGEGSGWIWGALWDGFGMVWEPRGGPNGHENRYISRETQVPPSGYAKEGFRQGSGTVWGLLGKVLGGFQNDFSNIFQ